MKAALLNWLDHRTGYRKVIEALLLEHIPGGAKWRYVWGSTLVFVFVVQLITGLLLMTAYSPGATTAWSSVYYIQYEMDFGWLIRGLHHFGSQTLVVLLGVHMLQVVIAGAHLPPREINWWLGLGLLGCVFGLSLTGYLLPWDQKGYWATKVATNIAGNTPLVGPWLQKVIVGGPAYGHQTLTRFFALHVGILPPLVVVLIIAHVVVFRRHGVTVPLVAVAPNKQGTPHHDKRDGWFWPDQAFRDMLASMVIFGIMLSLVVWGHGHRIGNPPAMDSAESDAVGASRSLWDRWAHAGVDGRGANLDAPADEATEQYPARPEWYFLFLFQLLKYFEGEREVIGTVIIPLAVGLLLCLLPLLGHGRMRNFGHAFGVLVVGSLLTGAAVLTYLALDADRKNTTFREDQEKAVELAKRAIEVAHDGIPLEGPVQLLRHDPRTRGKKLFEENCASCHNYGQELKSDKALASDLADFGTEHWIRDLLRDPGNPRFFGHTPLDQMAAWVEENRQDPKGAKEEELDLLAHWLASHAQGIPEMNDASPFARAYKLFTSHCRRCHQYEGQGGTRSIHGPDLTGYGSPDWVRLMIMAPDHPLRYRGRNLMPAFRDLEGPAAEVIKQEWNRIKQMLLQQGDKGARSEKKKRQIEEGMKLVHLSDLDRELIIRWLLKDYRLVFGGEPIGEPPKP